MAVVLVLALTACGGPADRQPGDAEATVAGTSEERPTFLGHITYRYDRGLLVTANVLLAIPPDAEPSINAIKLVPARGVTGKADLCPGEKAACPTEDLPGLSMALLERPYERYIAALEESDLADDIVPVTVDGAQGVAVRLGDRDGLDTEYRIVPVGEQALLLKLQLDGQSAEERAALARAIESIDLGA